MEKIKLRPYQEIGLAEAIKYNGFCLFMQQRTGKTPVAIEIARAFQPKSLMIVCPKIAIDAIWQPATKGLPFACWISTYESLWTQRRHWKRIGPDMVIADESHRIKDHMSKRSRALRSIATGARYRLALTGTPIEGGIEDAWAQFDFVDPQVFGAWKDFQARYLVYGGFKKHQIVAYQNTEEFIEKFHSRSFRVLLDDVTPEKAKIRVVKKVFPLGIETRAVYDQMLSDFIIELNGSQISTDRIITQTMKLHQITGGSILDAQGKSHMVGVDKLTTLRDLIQRLNPPFVVFCRFLEELETIARMLRGMDYTVTRVSGQNKFTGFDTDAAVVQIASGVAVDLARARSAIFYSMDYSHLNHDQARFRIRAYDSDHVTYYYLIAEDTVDVVIYQTLKEKKELTTAICDVYRKSFKDHLQ